MTVKARTCDVCKGIAEWREQPKGSVPRNVLLAFLEGGIGRDLASGKSMVGEDKNMARAAWALLRPIYFRNLSRKCVSSGKAVCADHRALARMGDAEARDWWKRKYPGDVAQIIVT